VGVAGVMTLLVDSFGMGKERTKLGFRCWGLVAEIDYLLEITKSFNINHQTTRRECGGLTIVC
jgi:hypothetical protein